MATATAKKSTGQKSTAQNSRAVEQLKSELDDARQQLQMMTGFLDELQKFSDIVGRAKSELRSLTEQELHLKTELADVRASISDVRNLIDGTNNGMLAVLEPGPTEFMPLFDRMERSDPAIHGLNSDEWREKPVSCLRLSPVASQLLVDADILFIGQLQDRVLDDDDWWTQITGLTAPMAAAIADKLADFVAKGGAL